MSTEKINPGVFILLLFIVLAAAMRVPNAAQVTPWAMFSPIGAIALFGGAYFTSTWKKFVFSLLALFLSDVIIGQFVFNGKYGILYGGWYWIYAIFAAIVLLGNWLIKTVSVKNVLAASVAAALLHWMVADFAVWAAGGTDLRTGLPLSRNWSGLQQCYIQGFPFMKNFLAGTLGYSAIMFGSFQWVKKNYPTVNARLVKI